MTPGALITSALRLAAVPAMLAATFLLTGCYQSDTPVIATSDKAEIAGTYACQLLVDDKEAFDLAIAEQGADAYHFAAPDIAGSLKLKKLEGERWLLQLIEDGKPDAIYYAFAEPMDGRGFQASYPQRDNAEINAAAMAKHPVRFLSHMGGDDPSGSVLVAAPDVLLQFLADPSVHDLAPWFACKPK